MGIRVSRAVGCLVPSVSHEEDRGGGGDRIAVFFPHGEPPDEGLGHSFCYVRPPQSPTSHSDRFVTEARSASFRSTSAIADNRDRPETAAFKSISGASVSANTSTPLTVVGCHDQFHSFANVPDDRHAAFESTASFASLPLQPVPRGVSFSGPMSGPMSGPLQSDHDPQLQQRGFMSGPLERGLMSGPLERGFISGPLERGSMSGPIELPATDRNHFSAPIVGPYHVRRPRRMRKISQFFNSVRKPVRVVLTRTISSTLARTSRTLVGPVRQFVWRHRQHGMKGETVVYETPTEIRYACSDNYAMEAENLQWAQGKAGEDRVHVVVSEEHGWLFVGIYDGFNGPDAPDFLMRNLYRAVYKELQRLLWDSREGSEHSSSQDEGNLKSGEGSCQVNSQDEANKATTVQHVGENTNIERSVNTESRLSREVNNGVLTRSRTLRELLADADAEANCKPHGALRNHDSLKYSVPCMSLKRSYSEASSLKSGKHLEEAPSSNHKAGGKQSIVINERAATTRTGIQKAHLSESGVLDTRLASASTTQSNSTSLIGPSSMNRQIEMEVARRKFESMENDSRIEVKKAAKEDSNQDLKLQRPGDGVVDHDAVLSALARALQQTEEAYLAMADCALEENPEIALMGSCILVALMKEKDVYVLNVGDSRAIVAQERNERHLPSSCSDSDATKMFSERDTNINRVDLEHISEESHAAAAASATSCGPLFNSSLYAVQLSTDHSTSIEAEVHRIKAEHPDDNTCISNDRVKGRLKVTRAFGAGFLKKPRWNSAILQMFQIEYIGSAPYISCTPALRHHRLGPNDRFLILSSDGLYQYFSNQEVVSYVEWFMEKFPEGDPAQYLIEELLFRAAKKAGMDFHDLLDIPQGDRRKYHDDVSLMIITIDGKIWKCSG